MHSQRRSQRVHLAGCGRRHGDERDVVGDRHRSLVGDLGKDGPFVRIAQPARGAQSEVDKVVGARRAARPAHLAAFHHLGRARVVTVGSDEAGTVDAESALDEKPGLEAIDGRRLHRGRLRCDLGHKLCGRA